MAKSLATSNMGTVLTFMDVDASGAILEELKSVGSISLKGSKVDATHYTSPDNVKEYKAGLVEPGELSFEGNYIEGAVGQEYALAAVKTGEVKSVKLQFGTNTSYCTADVIVLGFDVMPNAAGGIITYSGTLAVTGVPEWDV